FHILLTIILVLELLAAVWVFVFYYAPQARKFLGHFKLEASLKQAIVRYRDDDDLRDLIDTMQKEVRYKVNTTQIQRYYIANITLI
ncbi:hypothetical protein LSH36_814g03037, partial [Paralvinella palmiformis]